MVLGVRIRAQYVFATFNQTIIICLWKFNFFHNCENGNLHLKRDHKLTNPTTIKKNAFGLNPANKYIVNLSVLCNLYNVINLDCTFQNRYHNHILPILNGQW